VARIDRPYAEFRIMPSAVGGVWPKCRGKLVAALR
jgi:hypothetical protein